MARGQPNKHARLTEQELADASGKSVRLIRLREDEGAIMRGPDGLFDRTLALTALAARKQGGRPRKDGAKSVEPTGSPKPKKTRADWLEQLDREKAIKAKLERLEIQGALVRRSAAEHDVAEKAGMVRDQLLQIGQRLGPALAAESSARKCADMVRAEIERALVAIADLAGEEK